jgi:DNA-binding beta-propeller fold protein YncE
MGGYVLLAKMQGDLATWTYESDLWTTSTLLNPGDLTPSMSEAKLEAFTRMPITALRVGMAPLGGGATSWLNISLSSPLGSLQQMFASTACGIGVVDPTCALTANAFSGCIPNAHCSAPFVATSLGRTAWSSLPESAAGLESADVNEGFNGNSGGCLSVRLGFRANDDSSGVCPDSSIGFGMVAYGAAAPCTVGTMPAFATGRPQFGYILGVPASGPVARTLAGVVTTIAGNGGIGTTEGMGTNAQFRWPYGVAISTDNPSIYVVDNANSRIRKIDSTGSVSTLAGSAQGFAEGTGNIAQFDNPWGIAVDAVGDLYLADGGNNRIRKVNTTTGFVSTFAGSTVGGLVDGVGLNAQFSFPYRIAVGAFGNVYVSESIGPQGGVSIRKIDSMGVVTTLANGTGASASLTTATGIGLDAIGNLYVADGRNNSICILNTTTGAVTTFAGNGIAGNADGHGTSATFNGPYGIVVDAAGNVYVADTGNNLIRKVDPTGVVTTVAGGGTSGVAYGLADGTGVNALFASPYGVAVDPASGYLYVADSANHCIRRIT